MEEGFQEGTAVYIKLHFDETYYKQIIYTKLSCGGVSFNTLNWYIDRYSIGILINTWSTIYWLTHDQQSVNSQSIVSLVLTDSYATIKD